jgi:NAD(P)-dependent dehydrogenase (short-subunit alcohol dehydrogenase family)
MFTQQIVRACVDRRGGHLDVLINNAGYNVAVYRACAAFTRSLCSSSVAPGHRPESASLQIPATLVTPTVSIPSAKSIS